jgi:hypothetical protein
MKQQSNFSWQAQAPETHAPQFHELHHQSYPQLYDHSYSCQSAPQQQYQVETPPPKVSEELLDKIRVLIKSTWQVVEEMKAHCKQQADILKEEEEECQS